MSAVSEGTPATASSRSARTGQARSPSSARAHAVGVAGAAVVRATVVVAVQSGRFCASI